jgi:hypothetical protein
MDSYSPEPIEPSSSLKLSAAAEELLWDVYNLARPVRFILAIFMSMMAASCLWGAYAITSEFRHWIAWAFAVVLLEPVGIAALLAAVFLVVPGSGLGRWFAGSIRRAQSGSWRHCSLWLGPGNRTCLVGVGDVETSTLTSREPLNTTLQTLGGAVLDVAQRVHELAASRHVVCEAQRRERGRE